jgi:ribosome maturation factor RimP
MSPFLGAFSYLRSSRYSQAAGACGSNLKWALCPFFVSEIYFCCKSGSYRVMASRQEQLAELIAPVVESLGCIYWGLEYMSQGRHSTLRIFIDGENGVSLEDCANVSRQVGSVMDVEDPITGEYTLEVSSPGTDRPLYTLEHYTRYVGEQVAIRLRVPFEGRRKFAGLLSGVEGDDVRVVVDDFEYLLPIESIDKANIVPQF